MCGPDGRAVLDLRGKLPGRGAYLCPQARCLRTGTAAGKGVSRALGCQPPADSPEELRQQALSGLGRLLSENLGHAHRMGALVWGADRVVAALDEGRADRVLLARDAGENLRKDLRIRFGEERAIPLLAKEELGAIADRSEVAVVAVTHPGLGHKIHALAVRWNRLREEKVNGQG